MTQKIIMVYYVLEIPNKVYEKYLTLLSSQELKEEKLKM